MLPLAASMDQAGQWIVLLNGNDGDLTDIPMFSILQAMGGHDVTLMSDRLETEERGGHRDVLQFEGSVIAGNRLGQILLQWILPGSDRSAPHLIFP